MEKGYPLGSRFAMLPLKCKGNCLLCGIFFLFVTGVLKIENRRLIMNAQWGKEGGVG